MYCVLPWCRLLHSTISFYILFRGKTMPYSSYDVAVERLKHLGLTEAQETGRKCRRVRQMLTFELIRYARIDQTSTL